MEEQTVTDLKKMLIENEDRLINGLREQVEVYTFLHSQAITKIEKNALFLFTFRSFYNMETKGITEEFDQTYFKIMEEQRKSENMPNITTISAALYQVKNNYGNPSMQFPLVTNMVNTLNPYFPTFDHEIADLFSFTSTRHLKGFYKKMKRYLQQYRSIHETYCKLVKESDLDHIFQGLDSTFEQASVLPTYKKLDLLMLQLARQEN